MSETYRATINCRNCGLQFDIDIPIGSDVKSKTLGGLYYRKEGHFERHWEGYINIECPRCKSIDVYKDKSNWPWREEEIYTTTNFLEKCPVWRRVDPFLVRFIKGEIYHG